jgi:hypothetical protein
VATGHESADGQTNIITFSTVMTGYTFIHTQLRHALQKFKSYKINHFIKEKVPWIR